MPSALENLIKILKLERDQDYEDKAVIGGLAAYSENWTEKARQQARRPEHHVLVDEISDLLKNYQQIQNRADLINAQPFAVFEQKGRTVAFVKCVKAIKNIF